MFSYTNGRRYNLFQSSFAKQIVEIENNKRKILLHGNLKSLRSIIDIDDAMEAYWLTAKKGKIGEIYNIGGNKTIELSKFLDILKKKSKVKIITMVDKKLLRKTEVTLQIPDTSKFKKQTNWKPKVKFSDSVNFLLNEFRRKNR